jgi:peptide/nickel transport system substrate-binding protein
MNIRRFNRLSTAVILGLFLVVMSGTSLFAQDELPRNETLIIAGFQWGPVSTFNPLTSGNAWPVSGDRDEVYESLFAYNLVTGELDPVLASSLEYTDATTAVVTLQPGTHWQDGEELNADDVVFSFKLAWDHDDLAYSTLPSYISEINALDDRTIEFKLNPDSLNTGLVNNYLVTVDILPEHIWADRAAGDTALTQVEEFEPVGSGPYTVMSYDIERVVAERDDNWWGNDVYGQPAPRYIVHPIFGSNDEAGLALQRGEVDLSQTFTPQIWRMAEAGAPVYTWFAEEPYHVPGNIPLLHINMTKPGLDNINVRRALAHAINYPLIAATAMSNYSAPAQASLILPTGGDAKYFDADAVAADGWEYNPDEARRILEEDAGATMGSDGIYVLPDGTRLGPYTAMATFGWTDWVAAIELVSQSATEAGIEVVTEFPEFPVINARRNNGDFDMLIWTHAGAGPASPWQRFRDALDIRGVPPFGETAFWNWNRFEDPAVPDLLDAAAASTDDAEKAELFGQLDSIYRANIPAIPLMYRPLEFYEYNTTHWTGFPTEDNPYAAPLPERESVKIYLGLTPVE